MPQLIPFYFINQVSFGYLSICLIIWMLSKYILPNIPLFSLARMIIFNPKN